MATNSKYDGASIAVRLDLGAAASSGDVVVLGDLVCYALEDTDASDIANVELPGINRVVALSVAGQGSAGAAAVALGAKIYLDGTEFNVDATNGTHIGYALGTVSSGATATINVALFQTIAS